MVVTWDIFNFSSVSECPCYKDSTRNKVGPASEEDIQVLTVRDGEGKQLQEARFVEILKSAKSRIRSATESLRGSADVRRREAWSGDTRGRQRWVVRTSSDDDLELSRNEASPGESRLDSGLRLR